MRDDHDTTLPRFDLMAALARHPDGLKIGELSSYPSVSNGNVTGLVDRLAQDGLALRVAVDGDRRAQKARLTPRGARTFRPFGAGARGVGRRPDQRAERRGCAYADRASGPRGTMGAQAMKLPKPVSDYEAKALGPDGREVSDGEIGRLAVRGPTGCRYLNDDRQAA
jgi:hypothetical protein